MPLSIFLGNALEYVRSGSALENATYSGKSAGFQYINNNFVILFSCIFLTVALNPDATPVNA